MDITVPNKVKDETVEQNFQSLVDQLNSTVELLERRIVTLESRVQLPRTAAYSQDGTQSTVASGTWVEWNVGGGALADDDIIKMSTGSGQERGIVTLKKGHAFRLQVIVRATVVNGGGRLLNFRRPDGTNLSWETRAGTAPPFLYVYDNDLADVRINKGSCTGFETAKLREDTEITFQFITSFTSLQEAWLFIMEVQP